MAATALIRLSQGTVGTPGDAYVGVTGSLVTIDNAVNTDVNSWQIDIVYVDAASSIPLGTLSFNDNSSTPLGTFTPDVSGSYRIVLTVWDAINRTGTYNQDIRNFIVPEPKHGFIVPPYQEDPGPKPTLASGAPGAKPNETNVSGLEIGWLGNGTDGLIGTLIKQLDASNFDIVPDIGTASPETPLVVKGSTGDIYTFKSYVPIYSGNNQVVLPSPLGQAFVRVNSSGIGAVDSWINDHMWGKPYVYDGVSSGTQTWVVGNEAINNNGFIQEVFTSGSLISGAPNVWGGSSAFVSVDYDGAYLWVSSGADGNVYKVDPVDLTTATETLVIAEALGPLRIDQNAANYGGSKRGFICAATDTHRFTLTGTPTIDASLGFGGFRCMAVGTGTWNGWAFFGETTTIGRVQVDLTTGATGGVFTQWTAINCMDYDPVNNKLWVSAETVEGNVVVARIDPSTFAVEAITELSATQANSGFGTSAPTGRILFTGGYAWAGDPQASSPQLDVINEAMWRITPTSGSLRFQGGNGETTGAFTLEDLLVDFVAAGVQPGDLVAIYYTGTAYYFTVVTVTTTLLTLDTNVTFATTGLSYDIFAPMTKTRVALPGPKTIGYSNQEWTAFNPEFVNANLDAFIGDGAYKGVYKQDGDKLHVRILFFRGTTTTDGTSGQFYMPFPQNYLIDVSKSLAEPYLLAAGIYGLTQLVAAGTSGYYTDYGLTDPTRILPNNLALFNLAAFSTEYALIEYTLPILLM